MIIGSAAYFWSCEEQWCQYRHGRLVDANGAVSVEVASKEAAIKVMEAAVEDGRITEHEVPELRRQIMASNLPMEESDVGYWSKLFVSTFREEVHKHCQPSTSSPAH